MEDSSVVAGHFGGCFAKGESSPSKGEILVGHGAGAMVANVDDLSRQRGRLLAERLSGLVCWVGRGDKVRIFCLRETCRHELRRVRRLTSGMSWTSFGDRNFESENIGARL